MKIYQTPVLIANLLSESLSSALNSSQNSTEDFDWGLLDKIDGGGAV